MNDYMEWKKRMAERTCEKCLKTIDHIIEESNGYLDDDELDMLKDAWELFCMAHPHATGVAN